MNQFTASLWGDEAFSAILSMKSIPEIIKILINDTAPPLYNILEHTVFNILGTSEVVIRGLSFSLHLITVIFVFLIGKSLWEKKTGIWAGLLTLLNPFLFIYAFEGRMYSLMTAGVTASMYFFLKKKWLGYVLATAWALYSHHFAIFIVFVQMILFASGLIHNRKKEFKRMFWALLAIAIIYSPWLLPLYKQTKMVSGGFWLAKPNLTDLRNIIYEFLARGIKNQISQLTLYLVFSALVVRNWLKNGQKTICLLAWFLMPILFTWLISQKFQSIFYNRYMLYTIPAAMLVIASNRRRLISFVLLMTMMTGFLIVDTKYFFAPQKDPFRQLASHVKETQQEGDYLINFDAGNHKLWESKYYGIPAPIYVPQGESLPFFVGTALMQPGDTIQEIPKTTKRLGVITRQEIDQIKIANFTPEDVSTFGGLKFVWLTKNQRK